VKDASKIIDTFYIDVQNNEFEVHPKKICLECYSGMLNIENTQQQSTTSLIIKSLNKGGRQKGESK